jgi:hypothetical protein
VAEYDSLPDTKAHIHRVRDLITGVVDNLHDRQMNHDLSKLGPPEKAIFDAVTPRLKGLTYGSDEYKASLAEMGPALQHHYAHNSHHPEHYENGVDGMSLLDVIEMLCDWKAASERHADGDIWKSIDHNEKRFNLTPQVASILRNTAKEMGW